MKKALFAGVIFPFMAAFGQATDSLTVRPSEADKHENPSVYMDLFVASINDHKLALSYARQAGDIALELGDSLTIVRAEYARGYLYSKAGDYEKAIGHYGKASRMARTNGYTDREKAALNGLAVSYYAMSRLDQSLRYHFESLSLREKAGTPAEVAVAANNIGLVYYQLRDFEKAISYFKRALEEDDSNIEYTRVNLGLAYVGSEELDSALYYFNKTLQNCADDCDVAIRIEAYDGRAHCQHKSGDPESARKDYKTALKLAQNHGLDKELPSIYNGLAKVYIDLDSLAEAARYLDSVHTDAKALSTPSDIRENYYTYAQLARARQDFEKAYRYMEKYDSANNQMMNEVLAKNLFEVHVDFQERKNMEIIAEKDLEIDRANALLLAAVIITLIITVLVFLLFKIGQERNRSNIKLKKAYKTIDLQNKQLTNINAGLEERVKKRTEELKISNDALAQVNKELDDFIYKTSHDIRGPLATMQGLCNIALIDVKDSVALGFFQKMVATANKLINILTRLLVVNEINNTDPTRETVNITGMIQKIVAREKTNYPESELKLILPERTINFKTDYQLMKIILGDLVSNSFKFHNEDKAVDSFISINSMVVQGDLMIVVTDNGIEINEKVAHRIFDIFTKATDLKETSGIGLYLVNLAVRKLKGTVRMCTTEEGFNQFEVIIPGAAEQ